MSQESYRAFGKFIDNEMIHVTWQSRDVAQLDGGYGWRFAFNGDRLYNYSTHYTLARKVRVKGEWFYFMNPNPEYSRTSTKYHDQMMNMTRGNWSWGCEEFLDAPLRIDWLDMGLNPLSLAIRDGMKAREKVLHDLAEDRKEAKKANARRRVRDKRKTSMEQKAYLQEVLTYIRNIEPRDLVETLSKASPSVYRSSLTAINKVAIAMNKERVANFGAMGAGRNILLETT